MQTALHRGRIFLFSTHSFFIYTRGFLPVGCLLFLPANVRVFRFRQVFRPQKIKELNLTK
jgi:hypothetical protein